ncbi:membrane-bound alkaline phosphatase-like [Ochlerotatus camptorhynchus]|uniref:membrane-bound alkaline phosphatase-like n=1 Tax=Ochlerotatus camptorhynchus TaxID=644619 RepID=UPI0031D4AD4E
MSSEVINLDSMNRRNDMDTSEFDLSQPRSGRVKEFFRFICTKICVFLIIVGIISIVIVCVAFLVNYENDAEVTLTMDVLKEDLPAEQDVWFRKGLKDLEFALNTHANKKRAQNVILFVADGFHPDTMTAVRVHEYGSNGTFTWEHFPHLGLARWYKRNSVGTALFGGVGANRGTSGVDSAVHPNDCTATIVDTNHVESILSLALGSDLGTGFITNGDIRDGTPAALYAHVVNDSWTCPEMLPDQIDEPFTCLDTETQLMGYIPGNELNVIVGWNALGASCDSSLLTTFWKDADCFIAADMSDFSKVTVNTKHIRALFPESLRTEISLHEVVIKSTQILSNAHDGFLLVVVCKPVSENNEDDILELDKTVRLTMNSLRDSLNETLIIVVSSPFSDKKQTISEEETIDTAIHATGPMAHLFHKVHDPTYVAHVISYAARLGRFRDSVLASSFLQWFS